ncbi:MAG: right-handed parallel beta-helix repeat-containing protein [Alphaproteobacteria bacterium]|nr:right-handed parallel beta-helix repeat-containing protein [Alphaproteobacteria bacterium]
MLLSQWRKEGEAQLWVADGLPPPLRPHGKCRKERPLCKLREDLFVDGKLYKRVDSKEALGPGAWHYADGSAYLSVDPAGKQIEVSVTPFAFTGEADQVILKNLVIEKYASAAQQGAVDARRGTGWKVIDVTVRWNHGVGLFMSPKMQIIRGAVLHNGQLGIGGRADNGLVDGVEIAFNNYAGFSAGWEAGGTKFVRTDNLIVRNTCVHNNDGPGLWTDIDNVNIVYENNKVFKNAGDGIKHEISYKAVIRNNDVAGNGYGFDNWLWGSQILVQNSQDVEVYDNTVVVGPNGGNGISVVNQKRGSGILGPFIARNNRIEGNTIIHLGDRGNSGIVVDFEQKEFWKNNSNTFDRNEYFGVRPDRSFWMLNDRARRWDYVRTNGMEAGGKLVPLRRKVKPLSCDR